MQTVTQHNNAAFRGQWTIEKNVLYQDGNPVMTFAPGTDPRVMEQVMMFCGYAPVLEIQSNVKNLPPRMFLTVDSDALREYSSIPETCLVVEVTRAKDERHARFSLALCTPSIGPEVRGVVYAKHKEKDRRADVPGSFVDWS